MFLYKDKETHLTLRESLKEVLIELNPCDLALYEGMVEIFEKELSVVQDNSFSF